jgi:hypothetical protein
VYPVLRLLVPFRNMVFLLDDVECELGRTCETQGLYSICIAKLPDAATCIA